jgi:ATP-dependent Zn protease
MTLAVPARRELARLRRLRKLGLILAVVAAFMWSRILSGRGPLPTISLGDDAVFWLPGLVIISLLAAVMILPMLGQGRSPHVAYRPEQIEVGFQDVKGLGKVVVEVAHTLKVLLDHGNFRDELGGNPRRGILFEGAPGTGKTHLAKAMAKEANVPFLFVSATAFQSMWYGMTARRIRAFFRALRKAAAEEGGAIGFIEEIDAIGMKRGGPSAPNSLVRFSDVDAVVGMDSGGIVNELLVQMQSFDEPTRAERIKGWFKDRLNRFLPPHRQLRKHPAPYSNILVIGATNRAVALDPALLRPGRFDRILHFDLPGRTARRELIDYFLARKAHAPEMDTDRHRDDLASATLGYSPASLERLFDEALLLALRDNRRALAAADLRRARVEIEIGLPEPVDSPAAELATIATHEAGHAVMAYLVGKGRKLEMLSIIKRREALGFLAHRMTEERHTLKASEIVAQIQIALGGLVAEEMYFGESSTGPAGDLAAATNLGVEMVGSMGLGGSLISFRALDQGAFGGNMAAKVLADQEARAAVAKLLEDNKGVVEKVLSSHRHLIEALRDALIERHELMDNEILDVIVGAEGRPNVVIDLRDEALVG